MKKNNDKDADEMRLEYDLSKLKFVGRGIYASAIGPEQTSCYLIPMSGKPSPMTSQLMKRCELSRRPENNRHRARRSLTPEK